MANVVFNLTAEEGQAVNGFLRLVDAQKKAEIGARSFRGANAEAMRAAQDHGAASKKAAEGATESLGALATKFAGMVGASALAHQAITFSMEDAAKKAKALREEVEDLTKSLGRAGEIHLLPAVRQAIGDLAGPMFTEKQGAQAWAAISGVRGVGLTTQDRMEALQQAARAAGAGFDPVAVGRTFTQLRAAGVTEYPDAVGDLAAEWLQVQRGEELDESSLRFVHRMGVSGRSPREALRYLAAAGRRGEKGRGIQTLLDEADEDIDLGFLAKRPERLTEAGAAKVAALEAEAEKIAAERLEIDKRQAERARRRDEIERRREDREITARQAGRELHALALAGRPDEDAERGLGLRGAENAAALRAARAMTELVPLTEDQLRRVRLAGVSAKDRFGAIVSDPARGSDRVRTLLGNIQLGLDPADFAGGRDVLGAAAAGLTAARGTDVGFDVTQERLAVEAARERHDKRQEDLLLHRENIRERRRLVREQAGWPVWLASMQQGVEAGAQTVLPEAFLRARPDELEFHARQRIRAANEPDEAKTLERIAAATEAMAAESARRAGKNPVARNRGNDPDEARE